MNLLNSHSRFAPDNQPKLQQRFSQTLLKLSLLGQDQSLLTDCSEVIPVPQTINVQAFFPDGLTNDDVEQAVCDFLTKYQLTLADDLACSALPRPSRRSRVSPPQLPLPLPNHRSYRHDRLVLVCPGLTRSRIGETVYLDRGERDVTECVVQCTSTSMRNYVVGAP